MSTHHAVVVVGGGQAGLAMSWHLGRRGVDHVVFERARAGHEWRDRRWDSFCLVTPNWQVDLPGFPYTGDDPDGFMSGAEVVGHLERYAASFAPPLREGVTVTRLTRTPAGIFKLETTAGAYTADQVVVATGPYHEPAVPRIAERLPAGIVQLHSSQYQRPDQLPDGDVLVVGTGQSGCQIAEDLHLAGRRVHLAVGSAPRAARRYRGRDTLAWLDAMGHYSRGVDEFADADEVRLRANHYMTGRDGGRDIDLRAFALQGMQLYGRLREITATTIDFAGDLAANLDNADAVAEGIKDAIDRWITTNGIDAPAEDRYVPVWHPRPANASWTPPGWPRWSGPPASTATTAGSGYRSSTGAVTPPTNAARPAAPASTSSACPGSGPGDRAGSPASPATRHTWPTRSPRSAGCGSPRT